MSPLITPNEVISVSNPASVEILLVGEICPATVETSALLFATAVMSALIPAN
jgi:hypothetical protein